MKAFQRLKKSLRKYIYDQAWADLRPIQEATINMVYETDHNLILAAPTASGKTEAAFLPAISSIEDWETGIKILMLSPLRALINDQRTRLGDLCANFHIPVVSWHGEASQTDKKKVLEHPRGIIIMTPESLEAMFINHPRQINHLFSQLEWLIVDELHSFLRNDRGVQLQSLLFRLKEKLALEPRYVGLSATISKENYQDAKNFFPSKRETSLILDKSSNDMGLSLGLYGDMSLDYKPLDEEDKTALVRSILEKGKKENLLVFPNSKSKVEEISTRLNKLARDENLDIYIFAHHASIGKDQRQEAEKIAKEGKKSFIICATSTLELGIDIGAVDAICQVEAPSSASSLLQRLGRSGRLTYYDEEERKFIKKKSKLHFYASNAWSLIQGLAAIQILKNRDLDEVDGVELAYNVLAHQVLSMILEKQSMSLEELNNTFDANPQWEGISQEDFQAIVTHMIEKDYLEEIQEEERVLITGMAAEPLIQKHDFYAMFDSEEEYEVYFGQRRLGTIPMSVEVVEGARILLAAQYWGIESLDRDQKKIYVKEADPGDSIEFSGSTLDVSEKLRKTSLYFIHHPPKEWMRYNKISQVVNAYKEVFPLEDFIQWKQDKEGQESKRANSLSVFLGTKKERSLYLYLLTLADSPNPSIYWNRYQGQLYGKDLEPAIRSLRSHLVEKGTLDFSLLENFLLKEESLRDKVMSKVKYARLLPPSIQVKYIRYNLCEESIEDDLFEFLLN